MVFPGTITSEFSWGFLSTTPFFFYLNIVFKDHGDVLTLTYLDFEDSTCYTEFTSLFLLSNSALSSEEKASQAAVKIIVLFDLMTQKLL